MLSRLAGARALRTLARAGGGRLQRHVLGEFLRALALATTVFTGFFTLMVALTLEGQARKFGTDVATLAGALPYLMPYILCFSLPLAFLVAAVLAFGKLEGSGEIAAMRASGVRLTTVTGPVLALALAAAGPIVFLVDTGMEWGFARAGERVMKSGRASILSRAGSGTTLRVDTQERSFRIHRFGKGPDGREPLAVVEFAGGAPRQVILARHHALDAESGGAPAADGSSLPEGSRTEGAAEREFDLLRFRMGGDPPGRGGRARGGSLRLGGDSEARRGHPRALGRVHDRHEERREPPRESGREGVHEGPLAERTQGEGPPRGGRGDRARGS